MIIIIIIIHVLSVDWPQCMKTKLGLFTELPSVLFCSLKGVNKILF